jgi:Helix-turn-helix domain
MADGTIRREHRYSVVPEHLIRDARISDRAFRLWCILDRYAGADESSFPLRQRLADDLQCSVASLDRSIVELVENGWLSKKRRYTGGPNDYTVIVISTGTPVLTGEDRTTPHLRGVVSSPVSSGVVTGEETRKEPSTKDASEKDEQPGAEAPVREDVERICGHLSQRLTELDVKHAIGKRWHDAARLMLDLDNRTERQVHNMIDWAMGDPFWRTNVHSLPTLRAQYDKMRLRALGDGSPSNRDTASGSMASDLDGRTA